MTDGGRQKRCPKVRGGCGRVFYVRKGERRERCEECSPPRPVSRSGEVVHLPTAPQPVAEDPAADAPRTVGPVEAAVTRTLEARGRVESVDGQLALHLARDLEARVHSLSQRQAAAAEIQRLVALAVRGAPREKDAMDELEARRNRVVGA